MKSGHELLQMVDTLSREKGIDKKAVFSAIETAMQKVARNKYGYEYDMRVHVQQNLGHIQLYRYRQVVETVENSYTEVSLNDAKNWSDTPKIGDEVSEELPEITLGRVAAQTARQVIFQELRNIERAKQYLEFENRVGEVISGIVRRVEFGNVIVDFGRGEAILYRNELIGREAFHAGDRLRAVIIDVRNVTKGFQIFLSRAHPQFMIRLFEQEVPEIYDGQIQIKGAARDSGSRAKLAVYTSDTSIDPVGACVGMRGSRVQAVISELQGEKIDIILWSEDIATFAVNALVPAEVSKIIVDDEKNRIEAVVRDDQLSLAIGRRGQNVRLASQLIDISVDIISEEKDTDRHKKQFIERSQLFLKALDVDEMIADLLSLEGFETVEDVAYVSLEELLSVEGFDEALAKELQRRANAFIQKRDEEFLKICRNNNAEDALLALEELSPEVAATLTQKSILTRDNLADLSTDELLDLLKEDNISFTEEQAKTLIMKARQHWFDR